MRTVPTDYFTRTRTILQSMQEHVEALNADTLNSTAMRSLVLSLIRIVQAMLTRLEYLEDKSEELETRCNEFERNSRRRQWLQ